MDKKAQHKEQEQGAWSQFSVLENLSGTAAARLVRFAGIGAGAAVLDVACGTGVVALTAARLGANVTGVDITPALIARAKDNAALMQLNATWYEGDVEALPLPDAKFDVVVSQFGHMFGPRPAVALKEMLRVLKPGGTLAFSTWPPELLIGRVFTALGKYAPPSAPDFSAALQWGDPNVVRERLGAEVEDLTFTRDAMLFQMLSVQHYRVFMEHHLSPLITMLFQALEASDPASAAALRLEMEALAVHYFENNALREDYLMTRAVKR